jgi:putative ABC transport system permease protein
VAGALGIVAGAPLADAIVDVMADHGTVPPGFAPGDSWIPLVAAFGGGIVVAQAAVFAAARRAGRTRPAEALREAAIERARPGVLQIAAGLLCLGGGVALALIFKGTWAFAFAILEGVVLAAGTGVLGRARLGLPGALKAWPGGRLGAAGLLASTSLAANPWRTAALATPVVLVAMLAGTQGIVETSGRRDADHVTAARVTAPFVLTGRDGAPVPAGTAEHVARLAGVSGVTAAQPSEIYPAGSAYADLAPWPAAGLKTSGRPALDLGVTGGDLAAVRGDTVAVSRVFAETGDRKLGDTFTARLADTTRRTLRVGAVYERAAGLGDVVLAGAPAPSTALFVAGDRRALDRYVRDRRGLQVLTRAEYRTRVHAAGDQQAWAVWMLVGLSTIFAALALLNTARMAASERRPELAAIRLLGGTRAQALRTAALESLATTAAALAAGAAVVAIAVHGVPAGVSGIPLAIPTTILAAIAAGALALVAALVTNLKRT